MTLRKIWLAQDFNSRPLVQEALATPRDSSLVSNALKNMPELLCNQRLATVYSVLVSMFFALLTSATQFGELN